MHVNTKHRGEGVNKTNRSTNLNCNVTVVVDIVDLIVDMFKRNGKYADNCIRSNDKKIYIYCMTTFKLLILMHL